MATDDAQVTGDADSGKAGMSESLRERIVTSVNSMVLWGEGREAAMRKLEVNGITGEDAEAIYSAAMVERVATVHAHYRGKARKGLLLICGGLALLAVCFFVFHAINRILWILIFLSLAFGLWFLGKGMSGMLMSKNYEGSVADLDD